MKLGAILCVPLLLAVAEAKPKFVIFGKCKNDDLTKSSCKKVGGEPFQRRDTFEWECRITDLKAAKKFEQCKSPKMRYYGQCKQDKSGDDATKDACVSIRDVEVQDSSPVQCHLPNLSASQTFVGFCDVMLNPPEKKDPPTDEKPSEDAGKGGDEGNDGDDGDDEKDDKGENDENDDSGNDGNKYVPFPGKGWFKKWPNDPLVTRMGTRLDQEGCGKSAGNYKTGPGPQWTAADMKAYRCWQKKRGFRGGGADGWPGPQSWAALKVPKK